MIKIIPYILIFYLTFSCSMDVGDTRVDDALKQKKEIVDAYFTNKNIVQENAMLKLVAYKNEQLIKIYAKQMNTKIWQNIINYPFCVFSGKLGPKIKEGDKQIPEGFYKINRFNAQSKFHLSLGLNYPTKDDLILADKDRPGRDIFIHGGCSSIGCIAITDDKIKELYIMAENCRAKIEVIILPFEMTNENKTKFYNKMPQWVDFWSKLEIRFNKIKPFLKD